MEDHKQPTRNYRMLTVICLAILTVIGAVSSYLYLKNATQKGPYQRESRAFADTILEIGKPAPDFTLPAYPLGTITLGQYRGKKNVILAFYPRDNSAGCTREMCSFSDNLASFKQADTEVLGISCDTMQSHERFSRMYNLKHPLLSDSNGVVAKQYGVWVEEKHRDRRVLFVINKSGIICGVYTGMPNNDRLNALVSQIKSNVL